MNQLNSNFTFEFTTFCQTSRVAKSSVNFINILQAAFTRTDPNSAKKTDNLTAFFVHLGSARVKAAHRTLMKLTPGFHFCDASFSNYNWKFSNLI